MRKARRLAPILAALAALAAGSTFFASRATARNLRSEVVLRLIEVKRDETWRWQTLMGRPRSPHAGSARRSPSFAYRLWVLRLWSARAARAHRQALRPPHLLAWLCIQRYEGAWDDPKPPYYGGLQMDVHFQRTYGRDLLGRKGTADKWTPLEQMWVAERAHRAGRGFYPWPHTARLCGLI